jgi:membrane complex biogenesis BtpA family protein
MFTDARCWFVGMVHLMPLPGSPRWGGNMSAVVEAAERDARALVRGGCDAIIIENMGDVPYLRGGVHAETTAAMAVATRAVAALGLKVPLGVQVLAGANREALGVAVAAGAHFIRAEAFAYAHVADEGWLDASAGELLRARAALRTDVQVWADIQKKHASHAVTADLDLGAIAEGTVFSGADALVVTGVATGQPTSIDDVITAKGSGRPVLVGSGVTPQNAGALARVADGLIVGSWLKKDSQWRERVSLRRVRRLHDIIRAARKG